MGSCADHPYEPLSTADLEAAEHRLGFELPDDVRDVYGNVANGGFGPAYGLLGLLGGAKNEDGLDAVNLYASFREQDEAAPHLAWPEGLLPVGQLGCAMFICVDCTDSDCRLIWFEPNQHEPGEPWDSSFIVFPGALEKWLRRWLDGHDMFDAM